ncbi:HD domain-containing protein [Fusibacter bizertensis]
MDYREQQELFELKTLDKRAKKSMLSLRSNDEAKDAFRTEYQRDIDRILYSEAFRRLRLKTQTFLSKNGDMLNRTRLSHTLEVNQIAKTVAKPLYLNCDLIESISFGHDLGQTPFGHAGGKALNSILQKKGRGFHHNTQSLWLVEQLDFNRNDIEGKPYLGMNLTFDTLEGILKHAKYDEMTNVKDIVIDKFNPFEVGSLESQIVRFADRFSYALHDLYDADANNIVCYSEFENEVWKKYFDKPFDKNRWHYLFINDLIDHYGKSSDIAFSDYFQTAFEAVQGFIEEKIVNSRQLIEYDEMTYHIICEIYNYYENHIEYLIDQDSSLIEQLDKFGIDRVITDYIQWFGDSKAIMEYEKIKNVKSLVAG